MRFVTAEALKLYLETFHSSLRASATRFLPAGLANSTTHMAQLPARLTAYVSTQHGVAIDYDPNPADSGAGPIPVEVIVGSLRVEHLVLRHAGAPRAMLRSTRLLDVQGLNWLWVGIHLGGPFEVRTGAHIVFDRCLFSWEERGRQVWSWGTSWLEIYGDRNADDWTPTKAVERAKDEVLSALFEYHRAQSKGLSLKEYYAKHRERSVLVLGSYSDEGMTRLRAIEHRLAELGYEPILLCDVPDQDAQTLEQKVVMVGSLSRFVILDDSEKSGQLAELALCKTNGWVTVVLQPSGHPSSAMSAAASALSNVIRETPYELGFIASALTSSVEWAEAKRVAIGRTLHAAYPWIIPRE
jgi:hypothetical protein